MVFVLLPAIPPLQWGRNFIVAEMWYEEGQFKWDNELQWGRNFIVAEILTVFHALFHLTHASMGPQLYRCGNVWQTTSHH